MHMDSDGAFRRIAMRTTLVASVQRYLVRRAFIMAGTPWHKLEGTGPNFETMVRDLHPLRDPLGASAPVQPRVSRAPRSDRKDIRALMTSSGHIINEKDDYLFCIKCGRAGHKTTSQGAQKKMWAPKCAPLARFRNWLSRGHVMVWTGAYWRCSICDRKGQQLRRAECATAVVRSHIPHEDLGCCAKSRRLEEAEMARAGITTSATGDLREDADQRAGMAEPLRRVATLAMRNLREDADETAGLGEPMRRVATLATRGHRKDDDRMAGLVEPVRRVAKRKTGVGQGEHIPLPGMADPLAPIGEQWRVSRRRLREKTRQAV